MLYSVTGQRSHRITLGKALIYAVLLFWSLVCLFPLYWFAVTSLKAGNDISNGPFYLPFVDFSPSLKAWTFLLADPHDNLLMRYFNSAFVGAVSTLLTLLLGGLAVYGISRSGSGRILRSIPAAILATRLLPPVVLALPLYIMARSVGLLDTRLALIVTYTAVNLPVAVWLLQPVFGSTATDQEDAALLDGASRFRIFFEIVVPMAAMGIAAAGMLIFVLCWNEFLFAAHLAGDHAMTLPPWLEGQMSIKEAQTGSEAEEWANFSAATLLMAAPLIACTAIAQRALSRLSVRRYG